MYLSKSLYCDFRTCPKLAWLNRYKPYEAETDDERIAKMEAGNDVGELAKGLFGEYVDVYTEENGKPLLSLMLKKTQEEIEKKSAVICEAAFSYEGLYCAVDILRKTENGWAIYEVKSSTHPEKEARYISDVAYQKYVLEHCGLVIEGVYMVHINNQYIRETELNIHELFSIIDVSGLIKDEFEIIEQTLKIAEPIMSNHCEPVVRITTKCGRAGDCPFWKYCTKDLPSPSVFDLYRTSMEEKVALYNSNVLSFQSLFEKGRFSNDIARRQVLYGMDYRIGLYINSDILKEFMNTLSYPLYFLDFETEQPVIPRYSGTRPYQQIPFQYSLHYIEEKGGDLKHKEYLGNSVDDPRETFAERLCRDIPLNSCTIVYNKAFECARLRELANDFSEFKDHLLNIRDNIKDLYEPFRKGAVYNKEMGGSFSIKSVLPALFPDDPDLDYHNLEGVHNGGEAMAIYPLIPSLPAEEQEKTRRDLLKYCELDTFAMVRIWQELSDLLSFSGS